MSRKTKGGAANQGEGDYRSARHFNKASQRFVQTHDVAKLGRQAAPRDAAEATELKRAEAVGKARARGGKPRPGQVRRSPEK